MRDSDGGRCGEQVLGEIPRSTLATALHPKCDEDRRASRAFTKSRPGAPADGWERARERERKTHTIIAGV